MLVRSIKLMKPVTWFAPMWALLCGAVASGATEWSLMDAGLIMLGMIMAGPILLGASQVMNDYFDREIDAVNEPDRLIPSGRVSEQQVFITLAVLMVLGCILALFLGRGVLYLTIIGLLLALVYSAPPFRAKRNGWYGNAVAAVSYEGLAWLAGHVAFASLTGPSILIAALYSLGTHGIMSINDYKSIDGDTAGGIRTIPVQLGRRRAAQLIVATMTVAQIGVLSAFAIWGMPVFVAGMAVVMLIQVPTQRQFLKDPAEHYLKFSAIGVSFFVWGMLVAAIGLRGLS